MGNVRLVTTFVVVGLIFPIAGHAQGMAERIQGLNGVLDQLYDEMVPLCSQLISVGRGIAGFAALWYIASRVWKHLANAEPIDFYPLLRPFAIGLCIGLFPQVMAVINGVMTPTVTATAAMVKGSEDAVKTLLALKEKALQNTEAWKMYVGQDMEGDRDRWYKYVYKEDPSKEGFLNKVPNSIAFMMAKLGYKFQNSVKEWMSEILKVFFQAAALCINTLSTFQRVVLTILGPLVFGLAVFDGLGNSLTAWLSRYINVFLWVPVANIFGAIISKIQENMLRLDLKEIQQQGDSFFSTTDTGYLIFLCIAIVGYFTVPSVANFIVNAGGAGAMAQKVTSLAASAPGSPSSAGRSIIDTKKSFDDGRKYDAGTGYSGAIGRMMGSGEQVNNGAYQHSKLSGRNGDGGSK